MEKEHVIAMRTYNEQVELGMPNTPMNWHIWNKAFRIASIELGKDKQPDLNSSSDKVIAPLPTPPPSRYLKEGDQQPKSKNLSNLIQIALIINFWNSL